MPHDPPCRTKTGTDRRDQPGKTCVLSPRLAQGSKMRAAVLRPGDRAADHRHGAGWWQDGRG